jgi:branched-chain amino acid transport system ATP-binding protein
VAVDAVSFSIEPGECVAIVGANGAGKSTLLRSIAGLVRARSGTIHLDGRDITRQHPWTLARSGLRLVPESRELFGDLSVRENLRVGAAVVPSHKRDGAIESMFSLFPALRPLQDRRARVLSGGEQQMLVIARALVANPGILLLDEPSLGLAPSIVGDLITALRAITASGVTVIVAEQALRIPMALCQRTIVCTLGKIVADGPRDDVLTSDVLRQAFVGE